MGETKKVRSTGRFGARYGVGIRKRVLKIELKQKQKYSCPSCLSGSLKRVSRGIFLCKKCSAQFAGGTFVPQTLSGGIIRKMVAQKKFEPLEKELLLAKERESIEPGSSEKEPEGKTQKESHKKQ